MGTLTTNGLLYKPSFSARGSVELALFNAGLDRVDDVLGAGWIDYSTPANIYGWGSFINQQVIYNKIGKIVNVCFNITGTSNKTTSVFTLPVALSSKIGYIIVPIIGADNGTYLTTPAYVYIISGFAVCYLHKSSLSNTWTASGTKTAIGNFWYPID